MSPLMMRVMMGLEDGNLLDHIQTLEGFKRQGSLSEREGDLLKMLYERLDHVTTSAPTP